MYHRRCFTTTCRLLANNQLKDLQKLQQTYKTSKAEQIESLQESETILKKDFLSFKKTAKLPFDFELYCQRYKNDVHLYPNVIRNQFKNEFENVMKSRLDNTILYKYFALLLYYDVDVVERDYYYLISSGFYINEPAGVEHSLLTLQEFRALGMKEYPTLSYSILFNQIMTGGDAKATISKIDLLEESEMKKGLLALATKSKIDLQPCQDYGYKFLKEQLDKL